MRSNGDLDTEVCLESVRQLMSISRRGLIVAKDKVASSKPE